MKEPRVRCLWIQGRYPVWAGPLLSRGRLRRKRAGGDGGGWEQSSSQSHLKLQAEGRGWRGYKVELHPDSVIHI